jgi:hypothetical protein
MSDGIIVYEKTDYLIVGERVFFSEGALQMSFPALARDVGSYVAEYILSSVITGDDADPWIPMATNEVTAVSASVPAGVSYTVRYRYVTGSGAASRWNHATIEPMPADEGMS